MENFNNKRNLRPVPSLLWKGINLTYISKNNLKTLERFRFGGINFKLALPDPDVHGLRYMQTLTYCLANFMSRDKRVWEIVKNTASRNMLGSPVTVRHNNEDV